MPKALGIRLTTLGSRYQFHSTFWSRNFHEICRTVIIQWYVTSWISKLNEITPWFDGGLVYGTAKGWTDVLRSFPNGTVHKWGELASMDDQGYFPVQNTIRLPMANPPPPARHCTWTQKQETAKVKRFFGEWVNYVHNCKLVLVCILIHNNVHSTRKPAWEWKRHAANLRRCPFQVAQSHCQLPSWHEAKMEWRKDLQCKLWFYSRSSYPVMLTIFNCRKRENGS